MRRPVLDGSTSRSLMPSRTPPAAVERVCTGMGHGVAVAAGALVVWTMLSQFSRSRSRLTCTSLVSRTQKESLSGTLWMLLRNGSRHAGQDGQRAVTQARVETPRIEACALRGASERDQRDVWNLVQRVRLEAQSHLKDCMSTLARMRQCTRSEDERRTTRDCQARAAMNPM